MSKRRTNKSKHESRVQPSVAFQAPASASDHVVVAGMTVTWQPIPDHAMEQLPREAKDMIEVLHELVYNDPAAAIPLVRDMSARFPTVLCFRNWVGACFQKLGDKAMANRECETMFRDHPEYLFARLGFVELMLDRGDLDKAEATLFERGRTLRESYPNRTIFHVTEARHWLATCGKLAAMQVKPKEARIYRDWLDELEPGSEAVEFMDRLLSEDAAVSFTVLNALRKGLKRFAGTSNKRKPHATAIDKKIRASTPKERKISPSPDDASDQLELF